MRPDWFGATGAVLAGLGQDGTLQLLLRPSGEAVLRARRELLAERLAGLHCSGAVPGPAGRVFGRDLAPPRELTPGAQARRAAVPGKARGRGTRRTLRVY